MIENKSSYNKTLRYIVGFLEYLLLFVIIVECNSMLTFTKLTDKNTDMQALLTRLALVLSVVLVVSHIALRPRILKGLMGYAIFWAFLAIYALAFYLLNVRTRSNSTRQDYIINFLLLLPLLTLLFKLKQVENQGLELLYKYSDITCIIAAASVLVYLSSVFHVDTMPSDPIYTQWSNLGRIHERVNLLNACLFVPGAKWQVSGISLLRNNGFFVEPLMFSIPLITALSTEVFLRPLSDRYRYYRAALLSAALISASATICLAIFVAIWGLKGVSVSVRRRRRLCALIIICAIIGVCVFLVVQKKSLSYESTEVSGSSLGDHIEDYRATAKAFLRRPLLGGGYRNEYFIRKFMNADRVARNPGLSNSAGVILGQGGLMLGLLCLSPFLIGLLYIFRRKDRSVALWTIGPLGLLVGVIFLYRVYLIAILAFGYSLIEIKRTPGTRFPFQLSLAYFGLDDTGKAKKAIPRSRALVTAGVFIAAGTLLICYGVPIWQWAYRFLRTHQFSLSQSPLKAFAFGVVLVYHGYIIRCAARRLLDWKRLIALAIWDTLYLLVYPKVFSDTVTLLTANGITAQIYECATMLGVYFIGALLFEHIRPRGFMKPKGIAVALAGAACAAALIVTVQISINRIADNDDALSLALRQLTDAASGEVYVNDLPSVARRLDRKVSMPATNRSGYDVLGNASVLYRDGEDRPELFEAGFEVARLSDEYLVYTNDESVISMLSDQGIAFSRYYPFEKAVNLQSLAKKNDLKQYSNGALVIGGGGKMLKTGPSSTLRKGQYTLYYELSVNLKGFVGVTPDTHVCRLRITRNSGEEIIAQKDVNLGDFDENGRATIGLPFRLGTITQGIEYKLTGTSKRAVKLRSLKLKQTPDYITVAKYNCHRDPLLEAYYTTDGDQYVQSGGYSAIERTFAHDDLMLRSRYFIDDMRPVQNKSGYAEVRYGYNQKRLKNYEGYFGSDGRPVMISGGYSSVRTDYDSYGNIRKIQYLDTNDHLVVSSSGYAELQREYNGKKQLIRESYYDADGKPMVQTSGYSGMEQDYDEAGNVIARRFFDSEGPVLRTDGYAEVRWEYNGLHQIIRETFYGVNGEPVMIFDGYAADEREYDTVGNVIVYRYYDEHGEPTCITAVPFYSEVYREYNDKRWIIREEYRGSDGQPMLVYGGYASLERDYNEQGSVKAQRHYGLSGEPLLIDDGYFEVRREYDEAGHGIRETYYDTNGLPTTCTKGYAEIRRSYNDFDQLTEETFFTVDGVPAVVGVGYTRVYYEYTEDRQLSLVSYLDSDGETVQAGSGYLHAYLQSLFDKDLTIFISAKDEVTNGLTVTIIEDLKGMGLRTDLRGKYRNSFLAVITPDGVCEEIGAQKILSKEGMVGNKSYTIISAGFQVGNYCSIIIDGIDYAKNLRGMNIVVYDNEKQRVIDSVSFDTYTKEMTVYR